MVAMIFLLPSAYAHKPSDTYLSLFISRQQFTGQWDIALRDLEVAVGLDINADGEITWGELQAREKAAAAYALSRLHIQGDGQTGEIKISETLVDIHTDGAYVVLRFSVEGLSWPKVLEIDYESFFDLDPLHRGLLRLDCEGQVQTAVFSPEQPSHRFELAQPKPFKEFVMFLREGVWHIWIGFDHILFLVALLLPSVLHRTESGWERVGSFRTALVNVVKIVTAFTVAHSLTLSLATLQWVQLPSRLVESTIAGSVVLAALNNVFPIFRERGWLVAFAFGLIHGFGFANVLGDLGLTSTTLALALVGFNLGVEFGQLAIVAGFLPIAYFWRRHWSYQAVTLRLGSAVIALLAATWMLERAFDFKWLPF
ncbi:MAG: HupE/UreJ family protein [Verrucomicrobiota bacterium]